MSVSTYNPFANLDNYVNLTYADPNSVRRGLPPWLTGQPDGWTYNTDLQRYLYPYKLEEVEGQAVDAAKNRKMYDKLFNPNEWSEIAEMGDRALTVFGLDNKFTVAQKIESLEKELAKLFREKPTQKNKRRFIQLNEQLQALKGYQLKAREYEEFLKDANEAAEFEDAKKRKHAVDDFKKTIAKLPLPRYEQHATDVVEHGVNDFRLAVDDALSAPAAARETLRRVVFTPIITRIRALLGDKAMQDYLAKKPEVKSKNISKFEADVMKKTWMFVYNSYRPNAKIVLDGCEVEYDAFQHDGENAGFVAQVRLPSAKYLYIISNRGTQNSAAMYDDARSTETRQITEYAGIKLRYPLEITFAPWKRIIDMEPFIEAWIKVWETMPRDQIENIVVAGHSLGGGTSEGLLAVLSEVLPPTLARKLGFYAFESMRGLERDTYYALSANNPYFRDIDENVGRRLEIAGDPVNTVPTAASGNNHVSKTVISLGDRARRFLGILNPMLDTFDAAHGPHSMQPTSIAIELVQRMAENPTYWEKRINEEVKDIDDRNFLKDFIRDAHSLPSDFIVSMITNAYGIIKPKRRGTTRAGKKTHKSKHYYTLS